MSGTQYSSPVPQRIAVQTVEYFDHRGSDILFGVAARDTFAMLAAAYRACSSTAAKFVVRPAQSVATLAQ
jgi:hypothetical protein